MLLIVIAQVVVPLPQATFFTVVAPSFLPLSFVKVQAPAEPPNVKIAVPLPTEVIVFLSAENVVLTVAIYWLVMVAEAVRFLVLDAMII